jgi:HEAT repeat protein
LTGHANREVAFHAACALGDVGDREAIPDLRKAWRRRDALVRAASAASLRRLGGRPPRISPAAVAAGLTLLAILGAVAAGLFYR